MQVAALGSLLEPFHLPVAPAVAAGLASAVVLAVAFAVPRGAAGDGRGERRLDSWSGSLSRAQLVTRAIAVALLIVVVVAGRLGADDELENLAPALVVGAAWPLLLLAAALLGAVWRWLDPWDGLARAYSKDAGAARYDVRPAALLALVWAWYLNAYGKTLEPRSVGALVGAYTLLTVGGCLALGRARWLSTAEPYGLLLGWVARLPSRSLGTWDPPRGAELLLGVFFGGILFGSVRRSELWGDLNTERHAELLATAGVLVAAAAGTAIVWLAARASERSAVCRAAVPATAAMIVAVAMDRNRLFTAVQLLPGQLGDPFGEGWDLLGEPTAHLNAAPLGESGLLLAQLGLLTAGFAAGVAVAAARVRSDARAPFAAGLALLAGIAVLAITAP